MKAIHIDVATRTIREVTIPNDETGGLRALQALVGRLITAVVLAERRHFFRR
jgi:hypothetical protein